MSEVGKKALEWWSKNRDDRATMAKLRRCETAVDAASILAAIRLARMLGCTEANCHDADKALELAILLSHVRESATVKPMRAVGWKSFPGSSDAEGVVLSELRFQRLLKTTQSEKLNAFRRLIRLMKGQVNVAALAEDFWFWGDAVKKLWAFEYYNAAGSATQHEGDLL